MAVHDGRDLPANHRVEADLCIIGSGAAGLTIAHALVGSPHRVALLDSGGLERDERAQDLNDGERVGLPYRPLRDTWLRQFGGTTNHWTAHVRPLDRIDFRRRPWVPHSGWPFGSDDLAPFYARARRHLRLPEHPFDLVAWAQEAHQPWPLDDVQGRSNVIRIVNLGARRLAETLGRIVRGAPNVDTYLHSTVLEIVPDPTAHRIDRLRVTTDAGHEFSVRARQYVLATGGIENARLLLLSSSVQAEGLGNRHGLVGRFFANHFEVRAGTITLTARQASAAFYTLHTDAHGQRYGTITIDEAQQRDHALLNPRFQLFMPRGNLGRLALHNRLERRTGAVAVEVDRLLAGTSSPPDPQPVQPFMIVAMGEPAPNPDSQVRLGDGLDRLGQRKVVLDWRLTDQSTESVRRATDLLARQLGATGLGRLHTYVHGQAPLPLQTASFHHMGTTRMHADPTQGVVDATCRLHGIENLHVAGSSVFPTYGTANPTYTIMALAERLSDHLGTLL